jgi:hypothetical protein
MLLSSHCTGRIIDLRHLSTRLQLTLILSRSHLADLCLLRSLQVSGTIFCFAGAGIYIRPSLSPCFPPFVSLYNH